MRFIDKTKENIKKLNNAIKEILSERKFKYICFFWIIISIQFVFGNNLQEKGYSIKDFNDLIISLLKIILLSIIFVMLHYSIMELVKKIKMNKRRTEKPKKRLEIKKYKWGIYFLIIIVCWIPTLLAFYPAILSYDGGYQIRDYFFKGEMQHHPILITILYTAFYKFGLYYLNSCNLGMFLFSIFQMSFMALIFSYTVKFIEEETEKKWLRNISIIFYAIFPYNQLFPLITTKDVLFAGFFILFVINLYKMIKGKYKLIDYIYMIILSVLMLLSRNNAIYSLKLLLPFIVLILIKDKRNLIKIVSMFLIIIVLYQTINGFLYNSTGENNDEGSMRLFIFSQAVAKTVDEKENELTEDEKEKISFYFNDYKKLAKVYKPALADNTAKMINNNNVNGNKNEFFKFIIQLGTKYPQTFINSYLNTVRGFWYISDNSFNQILDDKYRNIAGALELYCFGVGKDEYKVYTDSKLPELQNFYKKLFCQNEYQKIPVLYVLFQPGIYFYITIAYLLYSIYKKDKAKLIIGILLFIYFASCFLAACAIVRYVYAIIVCVPIMGCFAIGKVQNKEE